MNIYIVTANENITAWDAFDGFVVLAESEDEALKFALEYENYNPNDKRLEKYLNEKWKGGKIKCIGTANENSTAGIVFESACNS